jgi:hypothetical protein
MNVNLTGFVTYHEMKSYMTRKYVEINKWWALTNLILTK